MDSGDPLIVTVLSAAGLGSSSFLGSICVQLYGQIKYSIFIK